MEALCSFFMGSQTRNVTQHQKYSGTRQSTSIDIVFLFFVCLFVCFEMHELYQPRIIVYY